MAKVKISDDHSNYPISKDLEDRTKESSSKKGDSP